MWFVDYIACNCIGEGGGRYLGRYSKGENEFKSGHAVVASFTVWTIVNGIFFTGVRNNGMSISKRSTDLLALTHTIEQEHFVERYQGVPLIEKTYITCMTSIRKSRAEWDAVSW